MTPRLDTTGLAPHVLAAMIAFEKATAGSGLERSLIELVKMRASQINGCAYCLDMHSKDARKEGETEARLYLLNAWHEAPHYTPRERAALAWTDALTLIAETHAPDEAYEGLSPHFTDEEKVKLSYVICAINCWNRMAIGFRKMPPAP